jgi:protein phosphatase
MSASSASSVLPDAPVAVPARGPIRVVGDVHGHIDHFRAACATDRFIVQLGDLTDRGPDNAGTLRLMLDVLDAGRGMFLLGNHDRKLGRALSGQGVRLDADLARTLEELDGPLRTRVLHALRRAPAWVRAGDRFFVHGGFHTRMLHTPPPEDPLSAKPDPLVARALFGQTTGERQADGYPVRVYDWLRHIPPGLTVYCGHDVRSTDGRPLTLRNAAGGTAVFLDTGAGKGGHLSWLDLDPAP